MQLLKPRVSNQQPRRVEIEMESPEKCMGCGWEPPKDPGDSDKWRLVGQFGTVFLFGCPKCLLTSMNPNYIANEQKVKDARESPIILPKMELKQ